MIFPVGGGAPLITKLPAATTRLAWSGDGRRLFVLLRPTANGSGPAYVLPLAPGHLVPDSIVDGLPSEQEILKLPGTRLIPSSDVVPGPTADIYAFTRESLHRNLYRIPVP